MYFVGWRDYSPVAENIDNNVFMMNYFRKDGKIYLYDNNTYSNLKEIYLEFSYSFLKDYQISGKFSVHYDSDNYKKNRKGKINITIFEKDDYNNNYKISKEIDITNSAGSYVDTDYTSFSFTLNDILGDNLKTISLKFRNPYIRISLPIEHNVDRYNNVLYGNILFDFTIFEKENFENKLFLRDNTVDISKYIDYMYIYFPNLFDLIKEDVSSELTNYEEFEKIFSNNIQKIKKYDFFNHVIYLEDSIFHDKLVNYMSNSSIESIYY